MFALPAAVKSGANLAYKRAGTYIWNTCNKGTNTGAPAPLKRGYRGGSRPYGYCIDQTVWFFWT